MLTENVKLRDERERHDSKNLSTNANNTSTTNGNPTTETPRLSRPTLRRRVSSWPVFLNTLELETDFYQDSAASAVTNPRHHQQVSVLLKFDNGPIVQFA